MPQTASEIANIVNQYNTEWRNKRLQEMKQIEAEISRNPLMHKTFEPRILELTKQLGMGEFEPFFRPSPGTVMAAEQLQKSAEEGGYQGRAFYGQPGTRPQEQQLTTQAPAKATGFMGAAAQPIPTPTGQQVTPTPAPTGPLSMQQLFRRNPVAMGITQPGSIDDLVKMMQAQAGQSSATAALAAAMGGSDKERNDWIQKQQKNYMEQYALSSGDALTQAQMDYDRLISGAPPGGEFRPFPGSTLAGGEGQELVPARRLPPSVTPKAQVETQKVQAELFMGLASLKDQVNRTNLADEAGKEAIRNRFVALKDDLVSYAKLEPYLQQIISDQILAYAVVRPDVWLDTQGRQIPILVPQFDPRTKKWSQVSINDLLRKSNVGAAAGEIMSRLPGGVQ